ncbi:hypothetical protein P1X14_12770 [Sphingomonas sp. AOB5]|uniref:hypothetical protein n=1 Tax=Sphingomonas sp. AOB5 TaxID=3034017 RepID=UPI0023F939BB|nr:hypothetical protein [Sphingomonas sp. AOB5]MDF7776125.1 hypothetical protein [Sphingomonas sp. AOB5]
MSLRDLHRELAERGFRHLWWAEGSATLSMLDLEIRRDGSTWSVADTERGEVIEDHGSWADESDACRAYLALVDTRYWHLTDLPDAAAADALQRALEGAGIASQRNDRPDDARPGNYIPRLFVPGDRYREARRLAGLG